MNLQLNRHQRLKTAGVLMILILLCSIWLGSYKSANAAQPNTAPQANGNTLSGFASPQFNSKQDVYIDKRGHVEELYIVAGGSWHVADLSALTGAPQANGRTLSGFASPQFNSKQDVYVDTKGHVEELYIVAGSSWHVADLTSIT